jgi:predicted  nucleic acid-binding Zn-ribbon protein
MSAELLNLSISREDALDALVEIRACHDELQAFLTATFDRLDDLVDKLRADQTGQTQVKRRMEGETLQDRIDQLARLAAELAQSMSERERPVAGKKAD